MRPPFGEVKYLVSETSVDRLGACAAEIAFVGRSNVGKSTLLNALCGSRIALVSKTPGRTRAINVFVTGHHRWIVDLPGYGYASGKPEERSGWGAMIETYLTCRPTLRMVFALIDAKVGPTPLDRDMLGWLEAKKLPWRVVATKADQVKASRSSVRRQEVAHALGLQPQDIAWVSADKGYGLRELRAEATALLES